MHLRFPLQAAPVAAVQASFAWLRKVCSEGRRAQINPTRVICTAASAEVKLSKEPTVKPSRDARLNAPSLPAKTGE